MLSSLRLSSHVLLKSQKEMSIRWDLKFIFCNNQYNFSDPIWVNLKDLNIQSNPSTCPSASDLLSTKLMTELDFIRLLLVWNCWLLIPWIPPPAAWQSLSQCRRPCRAQSWLSSLWEVWWESFCSRESWRIDPLKYYNNDDLWWTIIIYFAQWKMEDLYRQPQSPF